MKLLAVRVGRLGDMVMVTPALDALLERHPDAHLTLLTSPEGRRALAGFHPRLSEFWIHRRKSLWPFGARAALRRRIRDARFDAIYLFESNPSYRRLLPQGSTPVRVLSTPGDGPPTHFSRRCLDLVDPAAESRPLRLPVGPDARERASAELAAAGLEADAFAVGLHPSFAERARFGGDAAVRRHKTWPIERWGELARRLREEGETRTRKIRVAMDLAPEDRSLGEAIERASGGTVILRTPPLDFERYKAVLARFDLLIAPDTGPMHLAAAVGTPVVALFSGKDPADCGPFTAPERRAVVRVEEHAPDAKDGLAALAVEPVLEACGGFLPPIRD